MKRLVLYLVVLGLGLYLAKAVAPLIVVGVAGLVLLAWKRPDTVGTGRPPSIRASASADARDADAFRGLGRVRCLRARRADGASGR